VLGTNDAIVSTATLIIGVSAANRSHDNIALAGFAGLVDGAMSMAAGEYVSVSSKKDTDNADLSLERKALKENYQSEVE
jgi:VIT1/CCC1 family predicted Fe2+/Mn2+ transporter